MDDFNWMIPADDRVGRLPGPELQVDLPDIEDDVHDVVPEVFPVQMKMTAVESSCPPVDAQTRPKGGCDPVLSRRMCRAPDVLTESDPAAVDRNPLFQIPMFVVGSV